MESDSNQKEVLRKALKGVLKEERIKAVIAEVPFDEAYDMARASERHHEPQWVLIELGAFFLSNLETISQNSAILSGKFEKQKKTPSLVFKDAMRTPLLRASK